MLTSLIIPYSLNSKSIMQYRPNYAIENLNISLKFETNNQIGTNYMQRCLLYGFFDEFLPNLIAAV